VLKSIEEEGLLSFVTGSKRPFRMIQFFNRIGQKLPVGSLNVNQASQPHRPLAVVLRAQACVPHSPSFKHIAMDSTGGTGMFGTLFKRI
jgi:hypothetical protein